jgi:hypothetical protein
MSGRLLTLSIVILVLATSAFVIDVISPYTPTPTAVKVVFVLLCVLQATLFVRWSRYLGVELRVPRPRTGLRRAQRTLVVMICSLLC